ncbi:MAG: hypothetical protein CJBNEKGG_04438 [Prosthecobacter sp.]|nr:hypothetical protein [Prosthecobacter sp.]
MMKNLNTKLEILEAFPGAHSLISVPKEELDDLWSFLPQLDVEGVQRLLPCLMLTALEASEQRISIPLADQVVYYLDGIEKDRPLGERDLNHKVRIFELFSNAQIAAIVSWLDFVSYLPFTRSASLERDSALTFWRERKK